MLVLLCSLFAPAETPDVYIVERLFSSSLVVVVSTTMPQRMNIYHFKKGTEICNYSYPNNILSVKLNRQVGSSHTHNPINDLLLWQFESRLINLK